MDELMRNPYVLFGAAFAGGFAGKLFDFLLAYRKLRQEGDVAILKAQQEGHTEQLAESKEKIVQLEQRSAVLERKADDCQHHHVECMKESEKLRGQVELLREQVMRDTKDSHVLAGKVQVLERRVENGNGNGNDNGSRG